MFELYQPVEMLASYAVQEFFKSTYSGMFLSNITTFIRNHKISLVIQMLQPCDFQACFRVTVSLSSYSAYSNFRTDKEPCDVSKNT